jgi:hypothetical protein
VEAQLAGAHHRERGRARLDVGDDVRGQDHQALAGKVGEQVAEAHALFRIQADRRLVDDQQLRIVEQRLHDAHALAHAAE